MDTICRCSLTAPWTAQETRTALFVSLFFCVCSCSVRLFDINLIILIVKRTSSCTHTQQLGPKTMVVNQKALDCPVLCTLSWKKPLTVFHSATDALRLNSPGKSHPSIFFPLNHYWKQSHVSSNCPSHKPHPCCTGAASQCWSNKTRPVFTLLAVRWPFLAKRVLTWRFRKVRLLHILRSCAAIVSGNHSHYTKLVCGKMLRLRRDETDTLSVMGSPVS